MIQLYRPQFPGPVAAQLDFTLFLGPVTCFYHNCGGSIGSTRQAALCPSDVQLALGAVEDAAFDALVEVCAHEDPPVESVTVLTACTSAFSGLDFTVLERRAREELGLLCLHREHNRILLPAPGTGAQEAALRASRGGKDDFEQLAALIPEQRSVDGDGLLVMGCPDGLDPQDELFSAARSWGFDWVQTLGDWRSLGELERARSSAFVLVADERFARLGECLARRWGVGCVVVPQAWDLAGMDARYDELERRLGPWPERGRFRSSAIQAARYAAARLSGASVELADGPGPVGYARSLGIDAIEAQRTAPRNTRGSARGLRSGDEHFPTSGPAIAGNAGFAALRALPSPGSRWGYFALYDYAVRLVEEVEES